MIKISIGETIEWWFGGHSQQGIQGCLIQLVKKACFHKLHSWKQMLHTNYVNRENQKQMKLVNTDGINLVHNIFVFEIIRNFSSV